MSDELESVDSAEPSTPISDGVDGIRTTRMLERATRQRWPIPEKYKEAIIKRQVGIAISSTSKPREASAAARTVLNADKINIEQQKLEQPEQHLHLHQQIPHSKIFYDLPAVETVTTEPLASPDSAIDTDSQPTN